MTVWDVAVVGAGPAGAMAAYTAAASGARTVLLERATLPRYKTCGGGLIGTSLAALPAGFTPPVREHVRTVGFTHDGRDARTRTCAQPFFAMIDRAEFDAGLVDAATTVGAQLHEGVVLRSVVERDGVVELDTSAGTVRARAVVGADGSASRVGRHVGVRLAQIDLGLELELRPGSAAAWRGRVHLDWGRVPGAYAWVFPKGDRLTVGVIAAKGEPRATRDYLTRFVAEQGLAGAVVERDSGHLTRCREPGSPLSRGRVAVAGDAAGLLEPWTREGISYALRSGTLAGAAARTGDFAAYDREVEATLGTEMAAGARLHAALARRPRLVHTGIARTGPGWAAFVRVARGDATLAGALGHRPVSVAVRALTSLG